MAGVFSRWWAAQHGRQYSIPRRFGAFMILFSRPLSVIVPSRIRYRRIHWSSDCLRRCATGLIFVTPEFLVFKGHVTHWMSRMRVRRNSSDDAQGDGSGSPLRIREQWNAFLQERDKVVILATSSTKLLFRGCLLEA